MCYRRDFLRKNGIRFPEGLRLHEDVAFIPIAIAYAKAFAMTDFRGYNYVRNYQSLTGAIRAAKDPNEKVQAIVRKQRAFDNAIFYAMSGVAQAPISDDTKNLFIQDMLNRRADLTRSCIEYQERERENID